jgi:hypothetical protein
MAFISSFRLLKSKEITALIILGSLGVIDTRVLRRMMALSVVAICGVGLASHLPHAGRAIAPPIRRDHEIGAPAGLTTKPASEPGNGVSSGRSIAANATDAEFWQAWQKGRTPVRPLAFMEAMIGGGSRFLTAIVRTNSGACFQYNFRTSRKSVEFLLLSY